MVRRSVEYVTRLRVRAKQLRALSLRCGHEAARAEYFSIGQEYDQLADIAMATAVAPVNSGQALREVQA
jgi:hypothetical protein